MASLKTYYTFDDCLLIPQRSSIEPHEAVLASEIVRGVRITYPILSAAMDRVTEVEMAIALGKTGGLGVLHRNNTREHQCVMAKKVKNAGVLCAAACGPFDIERAQALDALQVDVIVIDCAHGHNEKVLKSAQQIKRSLTHSKILLGNVATAQAARDIIKYKCADGIKVGVGPGSICTTRIVSGVGVPQLSAVMEVAAIAKKSKIPVIADGGIRSSGDIVKALAAGASGVMLGSMFAGCVESPGKRVVVDGMEYKEYRGMGSLAVMNESKSSDRYLVEKRKKVAEGIESLVKVTTTAEDVLLQLVSGMQVGFGYLGAKTVHELQKNAEFGLITHAGIIESRPHTVKEK